MGRRVKKMQRRLVRSEKKKFTIFFDETILAGLIAYIWYCTFLETRGFDTGLSVMKNSVKISNNRKNQRTYYNFINISIKIWLQQDLDSSFKIDVVVIQRNYFSHIHMSSKTLFLFSPYLKLARRKAELTAALQCK